MSSITSHLVNLSFSLSAKIRFHDFFYLGSIPMLSVFVNRIESGSGDVKVNKGVESIYSSVTRYMDYMKNPFEGYTKNLIMSAIGYNNGKYFAYIQYTYDIKNLSAGDYILQYNSFYLQFSAGMEI